jgi:hypothetical protein
MKKLILLLILTISFQLTYAYTWEPYGPEGIKANKLYLYPSEYFNGVICVDTGMYIVKNFIGNDWEYYSYFNMPVIDVSVCEYNVDSILVLLSNGSYSDGIYSFNLISGQFKNLHYCLNPNVIYDNNGNYYVGYENGLLISDNGYSWTEDVFFNEKNCIAIQMSYENIAVAIDEPIDNVFWSENSGDDWEVITGDYKISDLFMNYSGLKGICSDNSMSCGYYEWWDYSTQWEEKLSTENLKTLGCDNNGVSFLGWYAANGIQKGIASYWGYSLIFLNLGLPNLNINDISSTDEFVGGSLVYCCTDEGVFYCMNYTGIEVFNAEYDEIETCPNPVDNQTHFKINLKEPFNSNVSISILNNQCLKVDEIKVENTSSQNLEITWNKGNLPAGVYYLVVKTKYETITEKFIIH